MTDPKSTVLPFYSEALTVRDGGSPATVLDRLLADDFESKNGQETKSKAVLAKQLEAFWKIIPDLRWEPKDVLVDGTKVVVRSVATGSPSGPFMGLSLDGSRSFCIDTIDIHEVRDGKIARVYHLEDWATALKQLAPR
ncbi:MAG: ester cyclase [Myxococcales bacterium]|nr:ester cyclase [Myxococcales bacterium]MBL9113113.1 ester cyclase [Myxococcales bacterium]